MQDKVLDAIESALGQSPQPDPDGAKFHKRDAEGSLVEVRPEHRVDPHAQTEAVSPAVPQKRPKTLRERLEDLVKDKTLIRLVTKSGGRFNGVLTEVTDEVIVIECHFVSGSEKVTPCTIVTDRIESYESFNRDT